jgi:hypothetical protein
MDAVLVPGRRVIAVSTITEVAGLIGVGLAGGAFVPRQVRRRKLALAFARRP